MEMLVVFDTRECESVSWVGVPGGTLEEKAKVFCDKKGWVFVLQQYYSHLHGLPTEFDPPDKFFRGINAVEYKEWHGKELTQDVIDAVESGSVDELRGLYRFDLVEVREWGCWGKLKCQ